MNPLETTPLVPPGPPAVSSGQDVYVQLREAFQSFTEASARFEEHYARLEGRIAELNLELEQANRKLRSNLEEKQRMQDYLSTLLESLPVGVLGAGPGGRVHSCNRSAAEILGCGPAEVQGSSVREVLRWEGGIVSGGKSGPGSSVVESWEQALFSALRNGSSIEFGFQGPKVPRRRVLRLRAVPTSSPDPTEFCAGLAAPQANEKSENPAIEAVFLIEDVTEMRRLEHQAQRNSRLAAMGEIAMNVAHEIRNPLGSIELFASMLQRDLADDPRKGDLAKHISTGVRCVDHIVANILQFARPQRLVCSTFELRDLIEETLLFAEHALRQKGIRLERAFFKGPMEICADAELLKQMFLNLFLNAIHATPEGGAVGVETIPNGKTIEVRVWDTGCGLAPDIIGRIFDPFFTTRRKGTGLGLTIVHNIVSVHEGSIEADNRPGGGALFSIVLPRKAPNNLDGKQMGSPLGPPEKLDHWEGVAERAVPGNGDPKTDRQDAGIPTKEMGSCPLEF